MRYRVLGPFDVEDENGRVLDLGRPKQRAVLAVLVVEANTVVSVDRLIDLVWGDDRPRQATASLHAYVSNLRRVLEPSRPANEPPAVVLTRPPGYLLRVAPGELDATRFESLAAEGRRLLAEGRPQPARRVLDEALALWRGDALADFADQKFARPAVARWDELRQVATEDRVQADLDLGAHDPAAAILDGLVARFPQRERLWWLLMLALYRGGRQGDALRAYARARTALMEELGVEPGPVLRRLESDILAHAPGLGRPPGAGGEAPRPVLTGPSPVPPLVGRKPHLTRLEALFADAIAGRGRAVLVSGDEGIGKTRLAEELAARAAAEGATVAWGGSNEGEGAPAYWPWVQVLRTVLAEAAVSADADVHAAPWSPWVAQMVPEAATALGSPRPPPSLDGESARFHLSEAVVSVLATVARRRPVVVVVDDLHWADAASIALLEFVALRLCELRLLVVGTFRPTELSSTHPLVSTLATLARLPAVERLAVGGLTAEEVASFVARAWDVPPGNGLAAALHARTDGNPFFLTELVKLLAGEGALGSADAVAEAAVPAGVRDVLRRRLGRLPQATTDFLRVAAVTGRTFDLDVVTVAAGENGDALEAVEGALATGVVEEVPGAVGRYRFTHALVRQALYDDLSAVRRARLHARVGAAVEGNGRDRAARSDLARHFSLAAPIVGPEKAIGYALDAAAEAQIRLAFESVEEHLGRALALIEGMPAGSARDRHELRVQNRRALALMMNGGFVSPAAARACDRAAELAVALGDTGELLSSMASLSKSAIVRSQWEVVAGLGERMIALGDASADPIARAAGLFALGNTELFLGQLGRSRGHVEDAIAVARPLWREDADPSALWVNPLVFALSIQGLALVASDEDAAATQATDEARRLAETGGHHFWLLGVHLCAAIGHAWRGRVDDAGAVAQQAVDLGRTTGLRVVVTAAAAISSWAFARAVPGASELARLRADMAACDAEGVRMWRPFRLSLLADACCAAERWEEAVAAADEGLAQCEASGERVCEAELHRLRGWALAAGGAPRVAAAAAAAAADGSLRRAIAVADAQGAVLFHRRAADALRHLHAPVRP